MTKLQRQIETRLGVDEAFAFVADFANAMHWDPGTASSERIDPGPVAVGSRYRLGVRMGSRVVPMEYRITTYDAPRVVVLQGDGSGVAATDEIRFSPTATGSHIDYSADIRLGGAMRLVQPFLGRAFAKLAQDAAEGMRRALDARADADVEGDGVATADAAPDPGRPS